MLIRLLRGSFVDADVATVVVRANVQCDRLSRIQDGLLSILQTSNLFIYH